MDTCVLSADDPSFPSELRSLTRVPGELRWRGDLPRVPGIAIVGTREPSKGGREYAFELGRSVASSGFAVWSGGALGVDQAAHEGALSVGGITVLVMGSGLDCPYPPGVDGLSARIVAAGGALVSIVADDAPPLPAWFLARNGVLAAMTVATVIVECPPKSGARSTSAAARRLGRPVWVVAHPPWSTASYAVRDEARLGARILLHADDLLASAAQPTLPFVDSEAASELAIGVPAPSMERVLAALGGRPRHPDELCDELGMAPSEVQVALATLALSGQVEQAGHGAFVRVG